MTPLQRWLVDKLSEMLEPDEREAVCGDFAESGVSGPRALGGLLSLVARRQVALWMNWRPWLTLAALTLPLGVLLSLASSRAASSSAIPIWMYLNNWTSAVLESPGSRSLLLNNGLSVLSQYLVLACWSWAAGFLLGALSRRAIPVNVILFGLFLLFARLLRSPLDPADAPNPNAVIFSLNFYRLALPWMLQAALVLLPSLWGMRQGRRLTAVPPLLRRSLTLFALSTVAVLAVRNCGMVVCSWGSLQSCTEWALWAGYSTHGGLPPVSQIPTLPLTLIGPLGYAVTTAIWRRRDGKPALA